MRRPVDLILPDTGPLITLATADHLELLTTFGRPVMIPDVIREEALAKPGSPGHDRLTDWFGGSGHNQYRIIATPLIDTYHHLRTLPDRPDGTPAANGMGETTLMWVVSNIESLHARDTACLVLTEDGRAGDQMPENVHILSTRSWLTGLQNLKAIASANEIILAAQEGGRHLGRYQRDRRGKDGAGNQTDWTKSVVLPERQPQPHTRASISPERADEAVLDRREKPGPAKQAARIKLIVTRDELARTIDLWNHQPPAPGSDPVVSLLLSAGDTVGFQHYRSDAEKHTPDKFEYGIRALTALESGFGKGRYRSLVIDVAEIEKRPEAERHRFDEHLRKALKATSVRAIQHSPEEPQVAKQREGRG